MKNIKRSITNEAGNKFTLLVDCDFSDLTDEQVREYAFDAIWIKEQATLRATSNKGFEDLNGNYSFKAMPKGTRVAKVMTTGDMIKALEGKPLEERLKVIEQLKAMK